MGVEADKGTNQGSVPYVCTHLVNTLLSLTSGPQASLGHGVWLHLWYWGILAKGTQLPGSYSHKNIHNSFCSLLSYSKERTVQSVKKLLLGKGEMAQWVRAFLMQT